MNERMSERVSHKWVKGIQQALESSCLDAAGSESSCLDLNPSLALYLPYELGQVIHSICICFCFYFFETGLAM